MLCNTDHTGANITSQPNTYMSSKIQQLHQILQNFLLFLLFIAFSKIFLCSYLHIFLLFHVYYYRYITDICSYAKDHHREKQLGKGSMLKSVLFNYVTVCIT